MAALSLTLPSTAPTWPDELLGRLAEGPLGGAGRLERAGGRIVARNRHGTLASAFQPVIAAGDGVAIGHQAYVRARTPDGEESSPWSAFAHETDGQATVRLDRLVRTVHALNYFDRARSRQKLFVRVEQRLLDTVTDEYGRAFEEILASLGASPSRVAIVLPATALDDPLVFVRAVLSYRRRGYAVAAQACSPREFSRATLLLAEPEFVILARPAADQIEGAARRVNVLHGIGVRVIARGIESAEEAAWSHAAGFDLLQGYHFGKPVPEAKGGRA